MDLVLLNDNILENDETLLVTINSTQQYADFVKISATQRELLLVIIENPKTDSTLNYSFYLKCLTHSLYVKKGVYIGLVEVYYKVVEGEQQYVTVCAALYQGKLGRDLTVMMIFLNSTLGDTGTAVLCVCLQIVVIKLSYLFFQQFLGMITLCSLST